MDGRGFLLKKQYGANYTRNVHHALRSHGRESVTHTYFAVHSAVACPAARCYSGLMDGAGAVRHTISRLIRYK